MSTQASEAERDGKGRVVQYDAPHPAGRDRRGVLLTPTPPLVDWSTLTYSLASIHGAVNPNVVRYQLPFQLCKSQWEQIQIELSTTFSCSFPSKEPAKIRIVKSPGVGFKYIDIETPQSNVSADEIVAAAWEQKWTVGGRYRLGKPQFVGLQTSSSSPLSSSSLSSVGMVHPIRFDRLPHGYMEKFLSDLPQLLQVIEPSTPLNVRDIWQVQYKQSFTSSNQSPSQNWTFGSSLVVLVSFDPLPKGDEMIADLVYSWPGWIRWEVEKEGKEGEGESLVLGLCFPGRYDYCGFCKYTAQALEGHDGGGNGRDTRRHKLSMCKKLICTKCGRTGHYDTTCKSVNGAKWG